MLTPSPPRMTDSPPLILVAEDDPALAQSLPSILQFGIRDIQVELHSSYHEVVQKLTRRPYQAVLSSPSLGRRDGFLLLNRALGLRPSIPFIVVAGAHETGVADDMLRQGASDLLTTPLDGKQVVWTVKFALWEHRLRKFLAAQERALIVYRNHMAAYPTDVKTEESFRETLSHVKQVFASFDDDLRLMDAGLECFSIVASSAEEARLHEAMKRLRTLYERVKKNL